MSIGLISTTLGADPFVLSFENVGGRIEAFVDHLGWFDKLTESQRDEFVAALRGLLDMAAVECVEGRNRVKESIPLGPGCADLARRVTWTEWSDRWNIPAPTSTALPQKGI